MPNSLDPYVRYSNDIEVKQPDEDRLIRETLNSVTRMGQTVFDKHRHAIRGAHAKGHGGLKGELTIYDHLPTPLAQGLFREPRTYPVMIRFSTAPGDIMPDGMSAFRGMAIKAIAHSHNCLAGFGSRVPLSKPFVSISLRKYGKCYGSCVARER